MNRRLINQFSLLVAGLSLALATLPVFAADEAADAMVQRLSTEVLNSVKGDSAIKAGDLSKIIALVDSKIMPNVNFQRMTSSSVGPSWRQATPEQQKRLQEEYKTLLVRTYAGALAQVSDQVVVVKPLRASPEDNELIVKTEVRGRGDPIQIDYRLEKTPNQGAGWKIYNINILGLWLVENYRGQFAPEISANGIDGLIAKLTERNKSNAKKG